MESLALLLARRLVHASLSCLIAALAGVSTWQVRDAEVEEGGKMRCQVARPKAHVSIVELVATVGLDPPGVRMPRDDETRAFTTGFVQAAEAPQERVAGHRQGQRQRQRRIDERQHESESALKAGSDALTTHVRTCRNLMLLMQVLERHALCT